MKIKKGDNVLIITGKDNGKRGTVEKAIPRDNKVTVTGVNIAKHHLKPSRKNPHGGIMDKLAPIDVSNVVLVCPHCGKPSRVGYRVVDKEQKSAKGGLADNRKKTRICKKCKESLE